MSYSIEKLLSIICQSITIAGTVIFIMFWPIKTRFEACEIHTRAIETILTQHMTDHKKKDSTIASLEAEIKVLNVILSDIKAQMIECKNSDIDLRNKLYEFITQLKIINSQNAAP